jgi:hypothetical protein
VSRDGSTLLVTDYHGGDSDAEEDDDDGGGSHRDAIHEFRVADGSRLRSSAVLATGRCSSRIHARCA